MGFGSYSASEIQCSLEQIKQAGQVAFCSDPLFALVCSDLCQNHACFFLTDFHRNNVHCLTNSFPAKELTVHLLIFFSPFSMREIF